MIYLTFLFETIYSVYKSPRSTQLIKTVVLLVPPNVTLPGEVLRLLPGYKMAFPAKGTPPIYTALIRSSTVLVNTTDTASIIFYEEGNYTCVATSDYGIYEGKFSVIFNGKTTRLK